MASSQDTWRAYIDLFPVGQQVIIQSLKTTYERQFRVTDFNNFEERLRDEGRLLLEEISTLPADTSFIKSLCQWLIEKARGVENWELYPERFGPLQEFASIIREYYQHENININEFRELAYSEFAQDLVYSIAESNRALWTSYIGELVYYYDKLPASFTITQQPQSVSGCPGDEVSFSVSTNETTVSYQWQRDGEDIAGATENPFELELVQGDEGARISVKVSKSGNTLFSAPAYIHVNVPIIKKQPENASANVGGEVSFSLLVTGENITYQWRKNQVPLSGKTQPVLSLQQVSLKDTGIYDCIVSTPCQTIISNQAVLKVLNNYTVRGKILTAERQPAQNYTVNAYHFEKGNRHYLGETRTNEKGNYFIAFDSEKFGLDKGGRPNLIIEVTHQGINQKSPLVMKASQGQVLNMITTGKRMIGINEFEQLEEWFNAQVDDFDWNNAQEQDIENFADISNFPKAWIKAYVQAKSFSTEANQVQGYYALLRSNSSFKKKVFLNKQPQEAIDALKMAKKRKMIPESVGEDEFINSVNTEFNSEIDNLISSGSENSVKDFIDLAGFSTAPKV